MQDLTKHISAFPFIGFVLGGIILYMILRIIQIVLIRFIENSKIISKINRVYSIIELFIGELYILWIISYFLKNSPSIGIVLSIILITSIGLIFWYAGRDFISGFIIKSNSGFRINSRIKTNDIEGVIINFYARNLKLINDKGEKLIIPYSTLINKDILVRNRNKSRISKHIILKIDNVDNYNTLIKDLRFMIMMHPKSLVNIAPTISILSHKKGVCNVEIDITARDNNGLTDIETYLKKELKNQKV